MADVIRIVIVFSVVLFLLSAAGSTVYAEVEFKYMQAHSSATAMHKNKTKASINGIQYPHNTHIE